MRTNKHKTKIKKRTLVLAIVFMVQVSLILIYCLIIPICQNYYTTHLKYPIYGGMKNELKDCELYEDMQSGKSFCFIGDSITDGNKNKGTPWYRPLTQYIKGNTTHLSRGGWFVHHIIEQKERLPACDVYVVAIGINDVLMPQAEHASSNPDEYIQNMAKIADIIIEKSPEAKIYFVAPWTFTEQDNQIEKRGEDFRAALVEWCDQTDHICINPHPIIASIMNETNKDEFLIDTVHPNDNIGVGLYSYAVLKADHDRKTSKNKT